MTTSAAPKALPPRSHRRAATLENGDHLDQPTFHARYKATPEDFKAELIGGIVYVPSPLKADHGQTHADLMTWLGIYHAHTPHTRTLDNATDILGPDSEPQPDACLAIEGGQTRLDAEGYLVGPPELIAEVASSTEAYDLYEKRRDYERYGAGEYLVLLLREPRAIWFVRQTPQAQFSELAADPDQIHRSKIFPGLWLDASALLRGDINRVLQVLSSGLATPEHAAFVAARKERAK